MKRKLNKIANKKKYSLPAKNNHDPYQLKINIVDLN